MDDLVKHVIDVCVEILRAEGFIHENGTDNYEFFKKKTNFLNEYTIYLVGKAMRLIGKCKGIIEWCNRRCLTILTDNGCSAEKTGSDNLKILTSQFENKEFANEIAQAYYQKLLEENQIEKELPTTTQFCKEY
uniref:Uncharacterized protein n=1 Tax=Schizaphis graminum TaxID=13262 RepID=A0A2S2NZB7_SCHGA